MNKNEIVVNTLKRKSITYAVTFLLMGVMYFIMAKTKYVGFEFGMGLTLFCALGSVFFFCLAFFRKPTIIVNSEGITHNKITKSEIIAWEKISEIYICIVPAKKEDDYYLGINYHKKENDKRKVKFKGKITKKVGDKSIDLSELNMRPYDVYNAIQKFYTKSIKK